MRYLSFILILINILLASHWIIDGNIFFHTDIARDFLLMQDIVDNRNLTLIGPRSGAIPGLFHGPLWIYLNLPAYILGNGNPLFVGWFWILLYILSLFIIYYAGKKMFDKDIAILSVLLLSVVTILYARNLFNPYGALMVTPLFFYFFHKYLQTRLLKKLILSLFLLGIITQFQMAFGVPILILTFFYLLFFLYKNKKLNHLISFFVLLLPLLSFLLFDLRNNFLQIRSVADYIFGSQGHGKLDINLLQLIPLRIKESLLDGLGIVTQDNRISALLVIGFVACIIYKRRKIPSVYFLFIYFYLGFWSLTFFFKGPVWNYYYLPFIPLLILIFISLKSYANKYFFYSIFILIYFLNLKIAFEDISSYSPDSLKQDVSTWKFNKLIAEKVFEESEDEFGYFIFTPDLYGYSPKYAMDFYQKKYKEKNVYSYQKKKVTYLLIAPPPEYGKDPESIWYQKNTNSSLWRRNDIKIEKEPDSITIFTNGFTIEKYKLLEEEIKVEPNPYLIKDIFFR